MIKPIPRLPPPCYWISPGNSSLCTVVTQEAMDAAQNTVEYSSLTQCSPLQSFISYSGTGAEIYH